MFRIRFLFWLDCALLVSVAVLQSPRTSSMAVHEWLGVAFALMVAVHLTVNWRWIVNTLKRVVSSEPRRSRINAALNALLFLLMTIAVYSGLVVSEVVLPPMGYAPSTLSAWHQLHSFTATTGLGVVGLHVALNWDWIVGVLRKGARGAPELE